MQAPDPTLESSRSTPDVETFVHRTEEYAREEPLKAVGVAFVAGLFMTLLPVGSIIAGLIRLSLALLRPVLLILGAVKLYEEIESRQNR